MQHERIVQDLIWSAIERNRISSESTLFADDERCRELNFAHPQTSRFSEQSSIPTGPAATARRAAPVTTPAVRNRSAMRGHGLLSAAAGQALWPSGRGRRWSWEIE